MTWFAGAGLLLSSQFNINYFAISEVDQWFGDFSDVWAQAGEHSKRYELTAAHAHNLVHPVDELPAMRGAACHDKQLLSRISDS